MFRICLALLRWSGKFALYAYFALMLVLVGVRYVVLPNIETWRGDIVTLLSRTLDAPVEVGSVQASWRRFYPQFSLHDVTVLDAPHGQAVFHLPLLEAELGWRTLLGLRPQFRRLEVDGLALHVRRDVQGHLHVLGQTFSQGSENDAQPMSTADPDSPLWRWLTVQGQLVLKDATLHWTDDATDGPPLVLRDVGAALRNRAGRHLFELHAALDGSDETRLALHGDFRLSGESGLALDKASGQVFVDIQSVRGERLSAYLPDAVQVPAGRWSVRWWAGMEAGRWYAVDGRGEVTDLDWQTAAGRLQADHLRWELDDEDTAWMDAVLAGRGASSLSSGLRYRLSGRGLRWADSPLFERPVVLDAVASAGQLVVGVDGLWQVRAESFSARNRDLDVQLAVSWQEVPDQPAGRLALDGVVNRLHLPALADYLPTEVNEDARAWMKVGLMAGEVVDARISVTGDVSAFPFGDEPAAGDFRLRGRLVDAEIDYAPAESGQPGWPRLRGIRGEIGMQKVDLRILADEAYVVPGRDERIVLTKVRAHIPNVERDATLHISADSEASAAAYLALTQRTPLAAMLDQALSEARGAGTWRLPLALDVPLLHSIDTTVVGQLDLNGGRFQLMPEMPLFSDVRGRLAFTELGIRSDGLKARFLGGPVALTGGLGGDQKGLVFSGTASDAALREYVGVEGMRQLTGRLPYRAEVRKEQGEYVIEARSSLQGLAMDLPAPLGKTADTALPLHVRWSKAAPASALMALDLTLGQQWQGRLLRQEGRARGSYFRSGALGYGGMPDIPAQGLSVALTGAPRLDGDAWLDTVEQFSTALPKAARGSNRVLLPPLTSLSVQADRLVYRRQPLDGATLRLVSDQKGLWRLEVASQQTTGRLRWREVDGRITGYVEADFDRLTLGGGDESKPKEPADVEAALTEEAADVPGIRLRARSLYWGDRLLGALELDGSNEQPGELWRLDRLVLGSPAARLVGTGTWHLVGADEGLMLDGQGEIADLGAYLGQLGVKDVMVGGKGALQVHLVWRGSASRTFDMADVNGRLEFLLEDGRISTLNSRSARLLEWLSLQSLNRLAKFDTDLRSVTKEGFPFDAMRGTVILDAGHLRTANYRISGPVGTLVLGGEVGLVDEKLDLEAVVVPNLDVSGAAVAAGIAINPLVGVGAFLTQWLLREPLARAMTARFRVQGSWDDFSVQDEPVAAGAKR